MLHAVCLLALAATPASLPGLEEKDAAALLMRAGVHEVDLKQCASAIAVYQRFFEVCTSCELLTYGRQRFNIAIARCSTPYEPAAGVNPADATMAEVLGMIESAAAVDPKAAAELMLSTLHVEARGEAGAFNEIRRRVFELLDQREPTREEVAALIDRLKNVDTPAALLLKTSRESLSRVRSQAISLLIEKSTPRSEPVESKTESICRIDPLADPGFVTVNSKPWGTVFVNGSWVGETPISRYKIAAGCAEIKVISPVNGQERVQAIAVRPNKVHIYQFNLEEAEPGSPRAD